ncbi:hypothetical protein [Phocaeicola sp.]
MKEFVKALVCECKSNIIPERHNLFGCFVGEWDFEWIDHSDTADERHVKGEWIFQWILEGTAVQDLFICPSRKERLTDYQPDAAYGTAVRMYNPDTEAWDILYTELGGAIQLEARRENDNIVQTLAGNKDMCWVFSEITRTSFHWQHLVCRDGKWVAEADLYAVRRK